LESGDPRGLVDLADDNLLAVRAEQEIFLVGVHPGWRVADRKRLAKAISGAKIPPSSTGLMFQ
jgi:hypothetical protein